MHDNGGCRNRDDLHGIAVTNRLVVADRRDHPSHTPEAELVDIVAGTDAVEFALDDGLSLTFSRGDLDDALSASAAQEDHRGA